MEEDSIGYGGFETFETYLVATWMRRDASSGSHWQETAEREKRLAAMVETSSIPVSELTAAAVAHDIYMAVLHETNLDPNSIACLLVDAACRRVDWDELADCLLNEKQEFEELGDDFPTVTSHRFGLEDGPTRRVPPMEKSPSTCLCESGKE